MPPEQQSSFQLVDYGITPWSVLLLFLLPLALLMRYQGIYPTRRMAWLAAILFALSLPLPWMPDWWWMLLAVCGGVASLLVVADLLTLPDVRQFAIHRKMARVASLGNRHPASLIVDNRTQAAVHMQIADDHAGDLQLNPEFHDVWLAPGKRTLVEHFITAHRRGAFSLENAYAHIFSFAQFWRRKHVFPCPGELHVYPDIKQIGKYALLARTNRLSQIGVRRTRKAGQDNDFERLRDYQQDDNYKHIDWRASARRQKLTVKQFQTDQSQRVIFMLDCGRMMTNEYQQLSLLDYALNSILMLSYVALDQGDSVGLLCFSDRIHTYVPPHGGKRQMNRILHAGFNQFPSLVQSRFDQAFLYLSKHCRKRSLVVLVTNVIDQVNAEQVENYMSNLIGCHLPLLVLLRDHRVFEAADNPNPDPAVLYRSAAASQLLVWRHQVIHQLTTNGALALDVFPEQMTTPLVNQYLEIKARHLL
ncbi:MAG: DUF58 domain-containing protein [bacterium]|nr:DUF58 domain-containing protein [bacterium]